MYNIYQIYCYKTATYLYQHRQQHRKQHKAVTKLFSMMAHALYYCKSHFVYRQVSTVNTPLCALYISINISIYTVNKTATYWHQHSNTGKQHKAATDMKLQYFPSQTHPDDRSCTLFILAVGKWGCHDSFPQAMGEIRVLSGLHSNVWGKEVSGN